MPSKIDSLIVEFTHNLRAAIAEEAAAAFAAVAGGGASSVGNGRRKPGPKPKGVRTSVAKDSGKRSRRSPEDIEKQAAAILTFVKKNPGSKAEAIGKAIGLTSLEMQIPIGQLLSEKKLSKKGERRATTYSAK